MQSSRYLLEADFEIALPGLPSFRNFKKCEPAFLFWLHFFVCRDFTLGLFFSPATAATRFQNRKSVLIQFVGKIYAQKEILRWSFKTTSLEGSRYVRNHVRPLGKLRSSCNMQKFCFCCVQDILKLIGHLAMKPFLKMGHSRPLFLVIFEVLLLNGNT